MLHQKIGECQKTILAQNTENKLIDKTLASQASSQEKTALGSGVFDGSYRQRKRALKNAYSNYRSWLQEFAPELATTVLRRPRSSRLCAKMRAAWRDQTGAVTAEYAILIMAAVAFAGLLVVIMRSGEVQALLTQLVHDALHSADR